MVFVFLDDVIVLVIMIKVIVDVDVVAIAVYIGIICAAGRSWISPL